MGALKCRSERPERTKQLKKKNGGDHSKEVGEMETGKSGLPMTRHSSQVSEEGSTDPSVWTPRKESER